MTVPLLHLGDCLVETRARVPISKRMLDVVAASVILLAVLPVMAMIAALVAVTSPGPVLFRQERFGLGGRRFRMLKFRTMTVDAEEVLPALLDAQPDLAAEMASGWKLLEDPRITPFGGLLRMLSLDELPQLVNVIRGEMSLVGPRPRRCVEELAPYGDRVDLLFSVPPGMTGSWQVAGRNHVPEDERALLDLAYAAERTLRGDLALLAQTVPVLLLPRRHGAY